MSNIFNIDQFNIPLYDTEPEIVKQFAKFFDEMDIDEEQKERRVKTSCDLYEAMLFFFTLVSVAITYNRLERTYLAEQLRQRWLEACKNNVEVDDYIKTYADEFAEDVAVVTIAHLDKLMKDNDGTVPEDSYWISEERAAGIAENGANTLINYIELQEAYNNGYTHKTWKTKLDKRVRDSHYSVEGTTIPLEEFFFVGDDLMMCPMDYENGSACETANCRCSLKFSKLYDRKTEDIEE